MIYFIRSGSKGPVKIGYVKNQVDVRIKEGQIFSPQKLKILATSDGDRKTEHALHLSFKEEKIRGEWFKASSRLLNYIGSLRPYEELLPEKKAEKPDIFGICHALAHIREARGMSQTALAAKVGMDRPNLSRMEGGFHAPSLSSLIRLLRALDAPWAALDEPPNKPCPRCKGTGKTKNHPH